MILKGLLQWGVCHFLQLVKENNIPMLMSCLDSMGLCGCSVRSERAVVWL